MAAKLLSPPAGSHAPVAAVPALIEALRDAVNLVGDAIEQVGIVAVSALTKIGAPAVPALIEALDDPAEQIHAYAAFTLGEIGAGAVAAVPVLIGAFSDPSEKVNISAAYALGKIGTDAVQPLIRALGDPAEKVWGLAALALGEIGAGAVAAVPVLIEALSDPDKRIRVAAATEVVPLPRTVLRLG